MIARLNRFKAILRVLEKFAELFTVKTDVVSAIETFTGNTTRIGELLSRLARSRKFLNAPKIDKELKLRKSLFSLAGLGVAMGSNRKDTPQVNLFKDAKKGSWSLSAFHMHEAAKQVYEEIAAYPAAAVKVGATAEILEAFQLQIKEFGELLDDTDAQLKDRAADRLELKVLFPANTVLLKEQIEPVIRYEAISTPAVLREFLIARRTGARKKKDSTADLLTEISGMVMDITTNEPIANATVDIVAIELVTTTDEDGYFLFEGVPLGDFIIGCHAANYRLPEKVPVKATGESLQIDFSLQPEDGDTPT